MSKKSIDVFIDSTDLLRFNIEPFLFGVLFSRIKKVDDDFFCGYTSFKVSKALIQYDFVELAEELVELYNVKSGYRNWIIHRVNKNRLKTDQEIALELRFYIRNNERMSLETFNNLVYKKLMKSDWIYESGLNDSKKSFVRGFAETRGSIDLSAKFIAQDYYYENEMELKRILIFANQIEIPTQYLNFNPRETQPNSKEKNTQFRINLFWYTYHIGFINRYKSEIFSNAYSQNISDTYSKDNVIYSLVPIPPMTDKVTFNKMLNFYNNNIFKRKLEESDINLLRNSLGFNKDSTTMPNRKQSIRIIFDNLEENKCACCGTTTTYTKPDGRQYFEIHHVISVHNEERYDNLGNLVKLCPNCHNSLKRSRAEKSTQIENIKKILLNKPEVFVYTSEALDEQNIEILSDKIWRLLG